MDLKTKENPHPDNWVNEHKVFARQNQEICQRCHTPDKCSSCHMKNKPSSHKTDWLKTHPDFGAKNKSSCETCHNKNACISCHKVEMPHPKDFGDTHKEIVAQKGKTLCFNCHKEKFW
jgi:predicted CXXCH cytochrome family protein